MAPSKKVYKFAQFENRFIISRNVKKQLHLLEKENRVNRKLFEIGLVNSNLLLVIDNLL